MGPPEIPDGLSDFHQSSSMIEQGEWYGRVYKILLMG
jgi:hypothetical protein